jgi:hypothetical protein
MAKALVIKHHADTKGEKGDKMELNRPKGEPTIA